MPKKLVCLRCRSEWKHTDPQRVNESVGSPAICPVCKKPSAAIVVEE